MEWNQNNLRIASSAYLRQHQDNPVWWQEWSSEMVAYAKARNKVIFASIGYATCHWCHVMERESFSNPQIAEYLNAHFVSVKVDREQRPDIDQYAMAFITGLNGQGGWPLNIFFTPELKPLYALTYAPAEAQQGMQGFGDVLREIKTFYDLQKNTVEPFVFRRAAPAVSSEGQLVDGLWDAFDQRFGGFGRTAKFPPHASMLFLLHYAGVSGDRRVEEMLTRTLDAMARHGLHDHLQGGFFRYCTDRAWMIPHFEKLLYDQALLLWEYALAYHVMHREEYRIVALKIIDCLEETFARDGLYVAGFDADTDHREGASYLWRYDDLQRTLHEDERARFEEVYDVSARGNFAGYNHLVKKQGVFLVEVERGLLEARNQRPQPAVDPNKITSWNCLAGIAFIQAYRYLGAHGLLEKCQVLLKRLLGVHYHDGRLFHSSVGGRIKKEEYLQDYAALLLFLTYLHEETGAYDRLMREFAGKLDAFKVDGEWWESRQTDFPGVRADLADHPIPSSISLADLAQVRMSVLLHKDYLPGDFGSALGRDFFNIAALLRNGFFHVVETPGKIAAERLPANAIQVRGAACRDCYRHVCREEQQLCKA